MNILECIHRGSESVSLGASFRNDRVLQIGDPPDLKDLVFIAVAVTQGDDPFAVGILDVFADSVDRNRIGKVIVGSEMGCVTR